MSTDLHTALSVWRQNFPEPLPLIWRDNCLENPYCAACRYCCGPQGADAPFPMALLPGQVDCHTADNFYLLNRNTAYIGAQGCKSDTDHGCRLPLEKRPPACGLFPIVLVNGKLYLYQNCPASILVPLAFFLDTARQAAQSLAQLRLADLQHISISLPDSVLASKYIDLHTPIFDESGKIPPPC